MAKKIELLPIEERLEIARKIIEEVEKKELKSLNQKKDHFDLDANHQDIIIDEFDV